jgi:glucan phosphorylase
LGGAVPIVKKVSRYKRQQLELLWHVRVGQKIKNCTTQNKVYIFSSSTCGR